MAAVSAAMLRPPGGGLDPPYFATQRMNYLPTEDTKSKKSWGQRLKLSPNGSSNSGHGTVRVPNGTNLFGAVNGPGGSSLSKSMKYAETWLYGTVRAPSAPSRPGLYLQYAEPTSPVLISTPQTVQNYAVIVCSCPEYLNGTKKASTKKVSICKKCKGSRLPLGVPTNGTVRGQVIGGTMRNPPPIMSPNGAVIGGTVKLQPTTKSRPTILSLSSQNEASDPYDLMRRTRLSSPLDSTHVGSQFTVARTRAKSISPVRDRSRKRSPSTETPKVRSKSVTRSKDLWYEDIQNYENEMNNRRSILECNVNPYDLMQKTKVEKSQPNGNDDDDVFDDLDNDDTFNLKKLQQNLNNRQNKKGAKHNGPYSSVQAIGGQRIRVFGETASPSVKEDFVYDDVEINGQIQNDAKSELNKKEVSLKTFTGGNEKQIEQNRSNKVRSSSPKRPPRRSRTETSEEESESDRKEVPSRQKTTVTKQSTELFVLNRSTSAEQAIKSILKKPRGDRPVQNNREQPPASPGTDRAISGSHFYLPTPQTVRSSAVSQSVLQRKKVQFLVENEIVSSHETVDEESLRIDEDPSKRTDGKSSPQGDGGLPTPDNGSHNLVNANYAKNNKFSDDSPRDDERSQSEGNGAERLKCASSNSSYNITSNMSQEIQIIDDNAISTEQQGRKDEDRLTTTQFHDGKQDETSDSESSSSSGKCVVLRRSQSERLTHHGSPESPSFMDTMALRQKPSRTHSKQVFISTQSLVQIVNGDKVSRPKERPPPPPSPSTEANKQISSTVTIVCGDKVQEASSTQENGTFIKTESDICKYNRDNDEQQNQQRIRFANSLPAPPPRSKSKDAKFVNKREPKYVKTRFVRDKHILEEVSTISFDNEDRTTVNVPSAPQIYESKAVHRLSVTQDDGQSNEENNRKTSIMIGGDDCYSTVNVNNDTPLYQSSVTINTLNSSSVKSTGNTVTISVYSESEDSNSDGGSRHSNQIYIRNDSNSSFESNLSSPTITIPGKTLVVVDYETVNTDDYLESKERNVKKDNCEEFYEMKEDFVLPSENKTSRGTRCNENISNSTTEEISILLRDPVEAVKRNLVPHVCGKAVNDTSEQMKDYIDNPIKCEDELRDLSRNSFVSKLLEDPMLGHLAEGLETDLVARLIENSLVRLKESRKNADYKPDDDDETMSRLIDASLLKLQEERSSLSRADEKLDLLLKESENNLETNDEKSNETNESSSQTTGNKACSPSYESMEYESGAMGASSDVEPLSDCYNASASELSTEEENSTRSKFYQMLVDATLSEIEISHSMDDDHHYESIRINSDPIYEEISDIPPPLPLSPPPSLDDDKKSTRSIFEGASKYDILSYLVDAKERGIVPEDSYSCNFNGPNDISVEDEGENVKETIDHQRQSSDLSSRVSNLSNGSDSSEDNSLIITNLENEKMPACKKPSAEIERNDSGVGSETSKCSRSKWQGHNIPPNSILDNVTPIHLCEDCDSAVETQVTESGVMYAPLVCRKCGKKRAERKEIITEFVETEEKYGRDLQIILEEFYQPMLVAGLLTQEQLSAIFLNVEELLENNQSLAERLRDALEIAIEQGDEDLLTVNIGKLMLESLPMLHAFSSYCVRQGAASMLLSSLEKEKELLRIFLKVSQMENTVLRRMNLNSFLMVPVQRVTKYPLLLSRLYKVTPLHLEGREQLRQAQQKIEQHLSHMNSEAKDVTTLKLWRRISSSTTGRRSSSEIDMINIKLRKLAVDVLEWNHDEARFAIEGKLLFTQPNDSNWRKGRTIKLTPINALLVTNGKPTSSYKPCDARGPCFPRNTGIREASLVLARDKGGRTALLREPLYLDRCVVATDSDWDDYFEVQEIVSKDTYIFKAEDSTRTKQWCQQLQYHCQGMGAWRKRRNALANIMINGMMTRN